MMFPAMMRALLPGRGPRSLAEQQQTRDESFDKLHAEANVLVQR